MRSSKAAVFCVITNATGLGCYTFFCSRLWADAPAGNLYADDGPDAISWFLTAFPFMALCALIDAAVLALAVRHLVAGRGWQLLATWVVVVGLWVLAQLHLRSLLIGHL